jgi:hypothetical protein
VRNVKKINLVAVFVFAVAVSMLLARVGIPYGFAKGNF